MAASKAAGVRGEERRKTKKLLDFMNKFKNRQGEGGEAPEPQTNLPAGSFFKAETRIGNREDKHHKKPGSQLTENYEVFD